MNMRLSSLQSSAVWEAMGVRLPRYDVAAMVQRTKAHPLWVHFGAGNIFRGFIAALQQSLLNQGLAERGVIAAETFDYDIVDRIYAPFDNLTLNVTLHPDGHTSREIIASVAEAVKAGRACRKFSGTRGCRWRAIPSPRRGTPCAVPMAATCP